MGNQPAVVHTQLESIAETVCSIARLDGATFTRWSAHGPQHVEVCIEHLNFGMTLGAWVGSRPVVMLLSYGVRTVEQAADSAGIEDPEVVGRVEIDMARRGHGCWAIYEHMEGL